ncbi:MAG TPA: type I-B CRISPR-associated protein Cas8b1/Cst1, partial [Aquificaceae bacterium]|nr:type I-B CRISPR-associated protein Cas8b1/Cst1 [Aquificaceae bacterium]
YRLNDKLQIEKNISADWLKESVLEVVKDLEKEKAEWLYQNIYVVEIEKADKNKANVYSFSIPLRITRAIKLFIDKYPPLLNDIFPDFLDYIYSEKNLYELLFKILVGYFFAESKYSGKVNDKVINFGKNLAKNKGKERKPLDESILYLSKFQEVLNMNEKEKVEKQIDWAYSEGLRVKEYLEKKYNEKAKKKIEGISYKILDAIRRRDIDAFQQNLIRAYLEVEREIPYVFVEALKEENFNRVAYAFLVGLNGRKPEGTS